MKIFLLFLFGVVMVTAGEMSRDKLQHVILEEIIQNIRELKDSLKAQIFVQKVITTEHCSPVNFCKAGAALSAYKAEELGLNEKDWLLPRKLIGYTRDISCKNPTTEERVKLQQLLDNIHKCAQKKYSES